MLSGDKNGSSRCNRKNCGGKRMTSPDRAMDSHLDGGRNLAAVCSLPPSEVGGGIVLSPLPPGTAEEEEDSELRSGRK